MEPSKRLLKWSLIVVLTIMHKYASVGTKRVNRVRKRWDKECTFPAKPGTDQRPNLLSKKMNRLSRNTKMLRSNLNQMDSSKAKCTKQLFDRVSDIVEFPSMAKRDLPFFASTIR